jgi:hypothetical protein
VNIVFFSLSKNVFFLNILSYCLLKVNLACDLFFSELELLVPPDFGGEVGRGETESLGDGAVHP